MSSEEATVILSAYPENQYERFLEDNIKDGLLYLKNKEALRRDSPVVNATRIATVSFNGLLYKNNIARFNENVNLKRVQNNGMVLQFISEEEKTIKVCNAAIRKTPEKNEDDRDPTLKEFFYFLRGIKIDNENYTAKCVFVLNNKNELYYDQNLSEIEKGKIIETILNKNMLGASSPLQKGADSFEHVRQEFPDKYYARRLNRICQVPQIPYMNKTEEGKWLPAKETIEAVRSGNLFIKKIGQVYEMQSSPKIQETAI